EHEHAALKEFYIKERLPFLEKLIWKMYQQRTQKNFSVKLAEQLSSLVEEFNQGLDFAHGKRAAYIPHIRMSANPHLELTQYVPAIENGLHDQKTSPFFVSGPAKGLVRPRVIQTTEDDHPNIDLSFLDEPLDTLQTDIQQESGRTPEDEFEVIVYQSKDLDDSDLELLQDMYGISDGQDEDSYTVVEKLEDYDDMEEYEQGEMYIFFDENIEPGMLLLELAHPEKDEVDVLYVPHIPLNLALISSLIGENLYMGGDVALTFSLADKNNNLILPPDDPNNPGTTINPLLN
ncbi:hypothetical protein KC721_01495, partial [Candidatus Woesebacteria bacterium]|nr:hypothetical protein [Candidatus Woesebacteria bacterium]